MPKAGDIVLVQIQFIDTHDIKIRPAMILFSEYNNIVVAGITSNTTMQGIPLTIQEGAIKDSVIKINYIFTISPHMIQKILFSVTQQKKQAVFQALINKLH
ncbi:MAG: type II toxin-antitoxin system PemK/MazF family toxin [Candidatus Woesearchaeota archaeon]